MHSEPTEQEIKDVLDELEDMDLPDGAYWALAHELLGYPNYETIIQERIASNPAFFGYESVEEPPQ